jgi:hypothetical protein
MTTAAPHTGTTEEPSDLVSALYHALQGADTCVTDVQDAEQAGDQDRVQFFREAQGPYRPLAERGKGLLRPRRHEAGATGAVGGDTRARRRGVSTARPVATPCPARRRHTVTFPQAGRSLRG